MVRLVSDRYPQLWVPRLGVRFEGGEAEADEGTARQLLAAGIEGVRAAEELPEEEQGESPPARSEPKAAWVAYAAQRGADPADAEAMTKADLVSKWG